MRILSIETSCDETAVSVIEATGSFPHARYTVLGNALTSQVDIHTEYGGVFPSVAKREHAKALVPMLTHALQKAGLLETTSSPRSYDRDRLSEILAREDGLMDALMPMLESHTRPDIDLIAVTYGPGLEPALWVGISFAKALATAWNIPVAPVNHMEGHVFASLLTENSLAEIAFPAVALLISGGHTELVLMRDWVTYELLGATRDDAAGEAFDKVARMLGLPYPGGPQISTLAQQARKGKTFAHSTDSMYKGKTFADVQLPRPMIDSGDCDFSFSGLKTAVLYTVQDTVLTEEQKAAIAREFEDAVTDVLLKKTKHAIETTGAQALILGGGVSANQHIRSSFAGFFSSEYPGLSLYLPNPKLSTDNAIMIALSGHAQAHAGRVLDVDQLESLVANGNLSLTP